jgi:hypothetical protein
MRECRAYNSFVIQESGMIFAENLNCYMPARYAVWSESLFVEKENL